MINCIDYYVKNGAAVICRCYGWPQDDEAGIELPEMIAGLKAEEIADRCFAPETAGHERGSEVFRLFLTPEGKQEKLCAQDALPEGMVPLCGEMLRSVKLPRFIKKLGRYAFYGCRSLESITFPASLRELGSGCFVACNHVRILNFALPQGSHTSCCMRDVLGELSQEVEVSAVTDRGQVLWRVLFPGYYEDSVENTPARIIDVIFEGMGFRYRQCFRSDTLDFALYDSYFYETSVQELTDTVLGLSLDRVLWPFMLSEESKNEYISWLRENSGRVAGHILCEEGPEDAGEDKEGADEKLERLLGSGFFTEEIFDTFIERASAIGDAAAVSFLMDKRRHMFSSKRTKYEL